jgi:hypothetical protein
MQDYSEQSNRTHDGIISGCLRTGDVFPDSVHFRQTLGRFIVTYERVIAEFDKGHVFISKKHISKVFELLESDDQE